MAYETPKIGDLFPAGGPARPEFVVGRATEVGEIRTRLREGVHVLLIGPRRIGKTTVCDKVCAELEDSHVVLSIEVPERKGGDARDLLAAIAAAVDDRSRKDEVRAGLRAAKPWLQTLLKSQAGVELDLGELGAEPQPTAREILELPRALAKEAGLPVLLFLDELQRVMDYSNGEQLLKDLTDLYAGTSDVMLLVDGSDERALNGMLGEPVQLAKLCERTDLSPFIPRPIWKEALRERFQVAGLAPEDDALELLLNFGADRPYPTMAAAQAAALNARQLDSDAVDACDAQMGIDKAAKRLRDEDV